MKSSNPSRSPVRRILFQSLIAVVIVALGGLGIHFLKSYVEKMAATPARPLQVVLANRPRWMSDGVAQQIVTIASPEKIGSAFDRQLLVDVAAALKTHPWIKNVTQVRRLYGKSAADTIEITCDYRIPTAMVHFGDGYWLVDSEACRLSDAFTEAQVRQVIRGPGNTFNLRVIDGIASPPPNLGEKWDGEDIAAGVKMALYLANQPFAVDVPIIDLTNFAGRQDAREAQINLITRYNTQIRWGKPITQEEDCAEVRPQRKLEALQRIYEQYGRVDANHPWLDLRFDQITYPSDNPPPVARAGRRR